MALFLFFAAIVVLAAASPAIGQLPGFLSIDCGLEAKYSGYKDTDLGIVYVSDGPYIDTGENHQVSGDSTTRRPYLTLRRFPTGERNCYALPTVSGDKYLVRVVIARDSQNSSSSATTTTLQFDLHLGANYWDTVHDDGTEVYEALFMAWASWAPVCLVNTGQGSPYASAIELRPLGSEIYPAVMANQSLRMSSRQRMGQINSSVTRFPDDQYDRFWWTMPTNPMWANLSTTSNIQEESTMFGVPSAILQKAVTVAGNGTMLNIMSEDRSFFEFMVFLHLADFQDSKIRQFNVYFNSDNPLSYIPQYLAAGNVYSSSWYSSTDGQFNITLEATTKSLLPPMLNAFEIYTLIAHNTPTTFSKDFDAIMAIKFEYGINKNWMGDPCSPSRFAWDGVICRNTSDNIPRIISLDLSNSNLHGVISNNFTLLTALENLCVQKNKSVFFKKQSNYISYLNSSSRDVFAYNPPRVPEPTNASRNEKYHWDHLQENENRQFTYEELEKITDNFQLIIGEGGFGRVYHGRLEDNTEVAVKMLSGTSSSGFNGFLAEVQSLTKVHHKNLVSLVGYCSEKAHLALVYEYMSRGNLFDHLRGLDYLHKGCNKSIIHRDVKTSNILLGQNLRAKIADFGLSRTYISDSQSHMSATVAGSMGYIDPEYYQTGWITENSDVYSFGVVLLEVVTGELPILQGHGHIIQRVKQKVDSGDISSIADQRLGGDYDVNSMWKVVEIALLCTEPVAARRPSMAAVVAQLKESLTLEEDRQERGLKDNPTDDVVVAMVPTFGPSAR
uniref:Protein kinase domain-containing protein n=1 Tax=Oryza barthii TaxID=65489 RepID=A0A0D3H5V4_9ORYZ